MTKSILSRVFAAGFLATLLSSAAVLAAPLGMAPAAGAAAVTHQATPVQMRAGHMAGPGRHTMGEVDRVEGRIAFLKAELKITEAQASLWEPVAKAMRDQSAALKAIHEQRPQRDQAERDRALNAPEMLARRDETLSLQAKALAARAAGEKQFAAAFVALYNQLSDEQKKMADTLLTRHGRGQHR